MKLVAGIVVCLLSCFCLQVFSQVRLPQLVRDGMVLQRDTKIKIWGWAATGEKITIKFNGKVYDTKADTAGTWFVWLPPTAAGGPYTMEFAARNKIVLKDILVGDVWVCAGQSNMVHQLELHDVRYAEDIAAARYPEIRHFVIPTSTGLEGRQSDLPGGHWQEATPDHVRRFSAVAYFFAKKIYERNRVPIGLINASVGGTPIEAWMSEEGLKEFPDLLAVLQKNKDTAYVNAVSRVANATGNNRQQHDLGLAGEKTWYDAAYEPKGWRTINIPGYWEDQGIKDLDGVVWYRREIEVPASMAGVPAKVFLGRIVDADILYINGREVGNTAYQYPQRRYDVPIGVLKPGKNIFVIRVTNTAGKGGFVPDKPYCLFAGNDTIDLKGYWQYKVGEVYRPLSDGGIPGFPLQQQPSALFNAMVAPLVNHAVKGILWYQGESNADRPEEYADLLPALIADWRGKWQQGDVPFLFVQLPNFMETNYLPSESNWALLREAQLKSLSVPNTAMAVTIDLGEWNDIHPGNKKDVGERLALAALKIAYGDDIVHSGPIFHSAKTEGRKIVLSFTNTGSGLITIDGGEPGEFAIAGADKKFVWAKAKIEGDQVVVWNDDIPSPLYVRYAWADNPVNPNLYNKEGLPASPFRTDR